MNIAQIPYSSTSDIREMMALASGTPDQNVHVVDQPYRFSSWAFDDPENCQLWVDEKGHILAWVVMQSPFWCIDIVCRPDVHSTLYPELLIWADQQAREILQTPYGHPMWFVNVFSDQHEHIRCLEDAGFASQADVGDNSWTQVLMQQSAPEIDETKTPPEGFVIRPLAGMEEVDAYADMHQAAFESKNMTSKWRARTLEHPDYLPELDLVAVSPDGRLAAFCVGWLHRTDGLVSCQIEPMGVHPDFQGMGLGRVTLTEALKRMYAHGADDVYVETDNFRNAAFALYESVGFRVVRDILVFRKDYAED